MSDLKERWITLIERDKWMTVIKEGLELEQKLEAKEARIKALEEANKALLESKAKEIMDEYDKAKSDGYFEPPHVIFQLAQHNDTLTKQVKELEEANGLIPVSERLPENGVYVLAWLIDKRCVLVRHSMSADGWYSPEMGWYGKDTVTHWKPITPPQGE